MITKRYKTLQCNIQIEMKMYNSALSTGRSAKYATPRNVSQTKYVNTLSKINPCIVIASGPAGTGKTKLAIDAGVRSLHNKEIERIIITRPIIPVGSDIGFLPGSMEDKMRPWLMPIYDALSAHYTSDQVKSLLHTDVIQIAPITYMRGRTFDNSWIVCDEAQNCTPAELLMIMTRIGKNSKMVITGDPDQHDNLRSMTSGLSDLLARMKNTPPTEFIETIEFTTSDIERHPVIPYVLSLFSKN